MILAKRVPTCKGSSTLVASQYLGYRRARSGEYYLQQIGCLYEKMEIAAIGSNSHPAKVKFGQAAKPLRNWTLGSNSAY